LRRGRESSGESKSPLSTAFIRSIEINGDDDDRRSYPLNLPAFRGVRTLDLDPQMTIFVGENGSGKSTLIEAIAVAAGFNAEGGTTNFNFATQGHRPELAKHLRLVRGTLRPRTGFFLRAESFFNVATEIERLDQEPSVAARIGPAYGPKPLHEVSHGESFLSLAMHRFGAKGLYILDEPEAAMSPFGCLALVRRFHDLVQQGSQFVIATHSPIVMAFPGALIYVLSETGPDRSEWENLDHVKVLTDFMNHKDTVIAELFSDPRSESS
jgi:predicted ATPase